MTPAIVALIGRPNSGKTTLLENLIPELNRRGLKIGTIKHHVHDFEMDIKGKDTWRHKKCGAHTVALSTPSALGVITDTGHDHTPEELLDRYFHNVDLVIAEGYKNSKLPKIEVFRKDISKTPLEKRDSTWLAMVSNEPLQAEGLPIFTPDDVSPIADFIIKTLITDNRRPVVTLMADGKPVVLKNFLERFLHQAVLGMVTSLKGCNNADEITLTIHNNSDHARK